MLVAALMLSIQPPNERVTFVHYLPGEDEILLAHTKVASEEAFPVHLEIWKVGGRSAERKILLSADSDVSSALLSPDGRLAAHGGYDIRPLEIRDLQSITAQTVRRFEPDDCTYPGYAFLPDGKTVALIASSRLTEYGHLEAELCDLASGEITKLPESDGASEVAVDPSGKWLAISIVTTEGSQNQFPVRHHSGLKVYDLATRTFRQALPIDEKLDIFGLVFSPDGKRLAVRRRDGAVDLWDTATWQVNQTLRADPVADGLWSRGPSIFFSADSRRLAVDRQGLGVTLFDLAGKDETVTFQPKSPTFWNSIDLSADGKTFVVGTSDGKVEFRNSRTGRVERSLKVKD